MRQEREEDIAFRDRQQWLRTLQANHELERNLSGMSMALGWLMAALLGATAVIGWMLV